MNYVELHKGILNYRRTGELRPVEAVGADGLESPLAWPVSRYSMSAAQRGAPSHLCRGGSIARY
jgi:hypothetical protein